jgi:hypothetical protein
MDIMKTSFFFYVLFLMFLGLPTTPLLAQGQSLPADVCYTTGEMMSDVTYNFMIFQGLYASKCDNLEEGTDKPVVKKYLTMHQEIVAVHKETFDKFSADLHVFIERNKIEGKQYFFTKLLSLNQAIDAAGVKQSDCTKLYGYMEQRRESWDQVIAPILGEMALRDAEYPKCE